MLCKWLATISCNYRHRYASKPLHIYNFISSVTNYINFHPYIILNDSSKCQVSRSGGTIDINTSLETTEYLKLCFTSYKLNLFSCSYHHNT